MLKPESEAKLKAWLAPGTWHTTHDSDMDRWYDFVSEYQRDHGYTIDEPILQEHITHQSGATSDELLDIIRNRISLAYNILDFLKRTRR